MQDEGSGLHESLLWHVQHEPCSQGAKEMRATFCDWAEDGVDWVDREGF